MLAYKSLRGSASSDHLDLVRGGAALAVMLGHLRNLFFVDFSEVAGNSTPLVEIVYLVTGFSHYAVMIFFVLSGFLVGGSVLRGRMDGTWSWSLYSTNRLTRLWVVLIPALLLGAILGPLRDTRLRDLGNLRRGGTRQRRHIRGAASALRNRHAWQRAFPARHLNSDVWLKWTALELEL